mgnify:CR=1 FL=1
MDIPLSLQDAQLWRRDLILNIENYIEKCYISGKWEYKGKEIIEYIGKNYFKMAKNSQTRSFSTTLTIGQLLLLTELKIKTFLRMYIFRK